MVDGELNAKRRHRGVHRRRDSACAGKERGRARSDSRRGGVCGPRRLLLRIKVASNIKGTESSVPVVYDRGAGTPPSHY